MTPTLRTALQGLVKTYRQTAYALEHTTGHYSEEARAYDRCSDQLEAILTAHPEAPVAETRQTLECPCCGCEGVTANAAGEFIDGTPLECGCPGWVSVSEDDGAWINNGDLPCVKCGETTGAPEASGEARTCATCNVHKRRIEGVYQ